VALRPKESTIRHRRADDERGGFAAESTSPEMPGIEMGRTNGAVIARMARMTAAWNFIRAE
jgi:hypothetical protein